MVSSRLTALLLLSIVSSPIVLAKSGKKYQCNNSPGTVEPIPDTNGTITINVNGGSCSWNFNNSQKGIFVIVVEKTSLSPSDTVKLTDANHAPVAEFGDVVNPGLFFASVAQPGVTLTIALSPNTKNQQKNVEYQFYFFDKLETLNVTAAQTSRFLIPLNKAEGNPVTADLKVDITPPKKAALVEVTENNTAFDLDGSNGPVALSQEKVHSILSVKSFNSVSSLFVLAFEEVGPQCSSIIKSPGEVKFDLSQVTMFQPVCAVMVKSDRKLFVDLKDLTLSHVADSITFFNGPSLKSTVDLQVVASSLDDEKKKLSNKILNPSSIIIYRGVPGKRDTLVASFTLEDALKSQVNVDKVTVEGGNSQYFIFQSNKPDKRVAFRVEKTNVQFVDFYCHDDRTSTPFFSVQDKSSMPSVIYSPSRYLRVVASKDTLTGSFFEIDANSANTTLCEESDALILKSTQVLNNSSASLLIPTRPGLEAVIRVSPLNLAPGDSFIIESLFNQPKSILKETFDPSIDDAYLPAIRLRSDVPHQLTYTRGSAVINSPLPQISLAYLDIPQIVKITLPANESYKIPVSSGHLDYFEPPANPQDKSSAFSWNVSTSDVQQSLHLSFSQIHLGRNQSLVIAPNGPFSYDKNSSFVPDRISKNLQVVLSSTLPELNARGASGNGFVATFRTVSCASELTFPSTKSIAINGTDCVYIVSAGKGDLLTMNVTINGDAKRANLTIIDDVTSSSSHFVNTTSLNETLISTKSSVIILFKTDSKANAPNVSVTLDKTTCSALNNGSQDLTKITCDNGERCIPQIRRCDGHFLCDDKTDEMNCNFTSGSDDHCEVHSGLSGWAALFLFIMALAVGWFGHMYGPIVLGRLRTNTRYSDFSNLAEDA